jgi:hypothetical protein
VVNRRRVLPVSLANEEGTMVGALALVAHASRARVCRPPPPHRVRRVHERRLVPETVTLLAVVAGRTERARRCEACADAKPARGLASAMVQLAFEVSHAWEQRARQRGKHLVLTALAILGRWGWREWGDERMATRAREGWGTVGARDERSPLCDSI